MKIDYKQEPKRVIGRQGRSLIPFAIGILVVLGLIFGGWGTVYAAQDSEPDDLLYMVKVTVEYLEDLTQEIDIVDVPSPIGRERNGIQDQDRLQDQDQDQLQDHDLDRTHIDDDGVDWEEESTPTYRWGQVSEENVDNSIPMTTTITGTQTMSMTRAMSMTQVMSGSLYGPGQCVGDFTEPCPNPDDIPRGHTYTFTDKIHGFQGVPPTPEPLLGFGAQNNTTAGANTPANLPVQSGTTTQQQKKGSK